MATSDCGTGILSIILAINGPIIDGVTYTEKSLDKLPQDLKGRSTATITKDGVTAFHSSESPLSNLHPCPVTIDDYQYASVEHYYATRKAKHAMDQTTIDNINKTPSDAQRLSKAIKMSPTLFEEWKRVRCNILKKGMKAKYSQNDELATYLKDTGDLILIEATRQKYWGIGKGIGDPSLFNQRSWQGQNQCGKLTMEVRDELNNE